MKKIMIQNTTYYPSKGGIDNYMYNVAANNQNRKFIFFVLDAIEHNIPPNVEIISLFNKMKIPKKARRMAIRFDFFFSLVILVYSLKNREKLNRYHIISRHPIFALGNLVLNNVVFLVATILPEYIKTARSKSRFLKIIYIQYKIMIYSVLEYIMVKKSKIYTLSNNIKKQVLNRYIFKNEDDIFVSKPGIDAKKFNYIPKKINTDRNIISLVTVCRLSKEKNIQLLIKSLKENKNIILSIIGDGPEASRLKELSKEFNVNERVSFHGFKKNFTGLLHLSDIFVLPSTYEGFGHAYIEAMATGLPCIALDSKFGYKVASNEIIIPQYNGELIDNSTDSLLKAIDKIINKSKYIKYSKNAYKTSCLYRWEDHLSDLLRDEEN